MDIILADLATDDLDEEDLLFLCTKETKVPDYFKWPRLSLNSLSEQECWNHFRFAKADLYKLIHALQIPDNYQGPVQLKWTGMEGLCILLRRLAYPNRLVDLEPFFGRGSCRPV